MRTVDLAEQIEAAGVQIRKVFDFGDKRKSLSNIHEILSRLIRPSEFALDP